jgi:predicted short-subunit dehydrogenase-like oxidoreductase (DUF2520 family)
MLNILLIGLGNVGTNLAKHLGKQNGINISIHSRNKVETEDFCRKNNLSFIERLTDHSPFDLVLICVNDDAIHEVVEKIPESTSVAYTSGAFDLKDLARKNKGVFYPLQTFQKDRELDLSEVPFFIEADDKLLENKLIDLGKRLSKNVQIANSEYRKKLHVAAVFVNNFTNFMLTQADDFLKSQNIPFDHLLPLLSKTMENVKNAYPNTLQTGPARRGDLKTIEQHKKLLSEHQKAIYAFLSDEIKKYYEEKL